MASIYGLYDDTGALRYIGKANDPEKRLKGHMRDARRRRTPLYDWIRKHGQPAIQVLVAASEDWKADERRLIAEARERGDRLLNVADGGDEPFCPLEVRQENGRKVAAMRGTNPARDRLRLLRAQAWHNLKALKQYGEKWGDFGHYDRVRAKMRSRAEERPDVFGAWKNV